MGRRLALKGWLVVVAAVGMLVLPCCWGEDGEDTHVRVPMRTLSARQYLDDAFRLAAQWQPDAFLTRIDIGVCDTSDTRPIHAYFFFLSESHPTLYLTVDYTSESGSPVLVRGVHAAGEDEPILAKDWAIDSTKALDLAQEAYGDTFVLRAKPDKMWVRLERGQLAVNRRGQGEVEWSAVYIVQATDETMVVYMDAVTGEVKDRFYRGP